jgi:hypothetical protein
VWYDRGPLLDQGPGHARRIVIRLAGGCV